MVNPKVVKALMDLRGVEFKRDDIEAVWSFIVPQTPPDLLKELAEEFENPIVMGGMKEAT